MENKDLQTIIDQLANEIIGNIRENIASYGLANGNLYNSLESNIDGNHLQILGANYFDYAQVGRGPTINNGGDFDFIGTLQKWIEKRQIKLPGDFRSSRQFAGYLAKKISKEGSYLYRHPEEHRDFLSDVLDEPLSKFQEKFHIFIKDKLQ